MTADFLLLLRFVFTDLWQFFTSWHIPGTNVSPASWALFALGMVLVMRYLRKNGGDSNNG